MYETGCGATEFADRRFILTNAEILFYSAFEKRVEEATVAQLVEQLIRNQ